ncbi:MAG: hypothetical protein U0T84_04705 [Chitinophagales bacterium]
MFNTKSLLLIVAVFTALLSHAGEFAGNKMLEILGEDKNNERVQKFRNEYLLDKSLKNVDNGIKLTFTKEDPITINTLLLANTGFEQNDLQFKAFKGTLPFDINWNDNDETLREKLGMPKTTNEEKTKYKRDGITINIFYKTPAHKKIVYIKFTQNIGTESPYRLDGNHEVMPPKEVVAETQPANKTNEVVVNGKTTPPAHQDKRATAAAGALPAPAQFAKSNNAMARSKSPFYNAIINVFESGEDEMFKDIKGSNLEKSNFWNYKYTYATKVNIPGEKYNMLYSFPFQTSQLDFVSVLEEADASNASAIAAKYNEIEGKLKEDFKLTEGWTYHYIINRDNPNGPKDFELKNSKLGSVVLDHSVNPYGKQVLYLRFLLQYD